MMKTEDEQMGKQQEHEMPELNSEMTASPICHPSQHPTAKILAKANSF